MGCYRDFEGCWLYFIATYWSTTPAHSSSYSGVYTDISTPESADQGLNHCLYKDVTFGPSRLLDSAASKSLHPNVFQATNSTFWAIGQLAVAQ